jgi:hypothetical protein
VDVVDLEVLPVEAHVVEAVVALCVETPVEVLEVVSVGAVVIN